jgi:putative Mg2+ transporter-C (MgtC) family protein
VTTGDELELVLRLLLALGLGAAIGLEREFRGHEAGFRTIALACLGAALFAEVSLAYGDSRVAAGVVQGIGFIGAGLVFQREGTVRGLTTATTIWVAAAIGLAVASELYIVAVLTAVGVMIVLELAPVSDFVLRHARPPANDQPPPSPER